MKKVFYRLVKTLVCTFVVMYAAFVLVEQQVKLIDFNNDSDVYSSLIQEEKLRNEQLLKKKSALTSSSYIEEVAREKLGLVMPYETVFVDANI